MMEIWKDVKEYEGEFAISNYGRIKSLARYVATGNNGQRLVKERIRVLGNHNQGYKLIGYKSGDVPRLIHREVAKHFLPNPDNKEFINHKDGNKHNNHVDNLEWATRQENEDHAYSTGLKNSTGSNNAMAKLDEDKVRLIRVLSKAGFSAKSLAIDFGVHAVTINRIKNNKIWQAA